MFRFLLGTEGEVEGKEGGRRPGPALLFHPQIESAEITVVSGKKPVKPHSCQIASFCSYF